MPAPAAPRTEPTLAARAVLLVLALATVLLGFFQGPLGDWLQR